MPTSNISRLMSTEGAKSSLQPRCHLSPQVSARPYPQTKIAQGAMEDHQIHEVLDVSQGTIRRVRKKFATGGLETALVISVWQTLKFDGYQPHKSPP